MFGGLLDSTKLDGLIDSHRRRERDLFYDTHANKDRDEENFQDA